jgi:serine/threonine protein kinase
MKHHLDGASCVWEVISFYEYAEQSLEKELESRVEAQNYFDEDEIWSLLYSVVLGCAYLQEHNIGHGCITTSDIYLADNGHIRIVDPTLSSLSPYYLSEGYYYSPEMIGKFRGNAHMGEVNIFKSDVFTLAMCLLHCCLLDSCDDCYDY